MTHRCLCSSVNPGPCWKNNNLLTRFTKLSNQPLSICQQKRILHQLNYVREPIISVQAQQQQQQKQITSTSVKCKSTDANQCYAEYNINSFRRGFGQLKDLQYETIEPGKPSLVIHSSTITKNENDLVILTNQLLKELPQLQLRKRFALAHTEKHVYIIGGYIYEHRIPARKQPSHDYKYEIETHQFIPIQPLPNGTIGFGCCIDEDYIYTVGGNDINNRPSSDCYRLHIQNSNEQWTRLPNLPAPTTGPGLGVYNGELHCIGGYDILGKESIAHGEYLTLRYPQQQQWHYGPELDIARARPLVFIIPNDSKSGEDIYAAGGFNVNQQTSKPYIVPDVQLFNTTTQRWQHLTTIPDLALTHALSINENKLHVSETIELPDQLPDTKILRSFDLRKRIWTEPQDDSDDTETITSVSPLNSTTHQANQINKSTLQLPSSKSKQQNNTKTSHEKHHPSNVQNKLPTNTKPKSSNLSSSSTSKQRTHQK